MTISSTETDQHGEDSTPVGGYAMISNGGTAACRHREAAFFPGNTCMPTQRDGMMNIYHQEVCE